MEAVDVILMARMKKHIRNKLDLGAKFVYRKMPADNEPVVYVFVSYIDNLSLMSEITAAPDLETMHSKQYYLTDHNGVYLGMDDAWL